MSKFIDKLLERETRQYNNYYNDAALNDNTITKFLLTGGLLKGGVSLTVQPYKRNIAPIIYKLGTFKQVVGRNKNKLKKYNSLADYIEEFGNNFEQVPPNYTISNIEEALKDLNITEDTPKIYKTPIGDLPLRVDRAIHILGGGGDGHPPDPTRYKNLNRMSATVARPDVITKYNNGNSAYLKAFRNNDEIKTQVVPVHNDGNGNYIYTSIPTSNSERYFIKQINNGDVIYKDRTRVPKNPAVNNIITNFSNKIKPMSEFLKRLLNLQRGN